MKWIGGFLLWSALVIVSGCTLWKREPLRYSSDAIRMRVVDKATQQPLEGVMVVAAWKSYIGTHQHYTGSVHIAEAATNKDGWFELAAWGPVENKEPGGLLDYQPLIWMYKEGHKYFGVHNDPPFDGGDGFPKHAPEHLTFHYQDQSQTVNLEPTSAAEESEGIYLMSFVSGLQFLFEDVKNCGVLKIPLTIERLSVIRDKRERAGKLGLYSLPRELSHLSHCFSE
jgi:hypothetical protein